MFLISKLKYTFFCRISIQHLPTNIMPTLLKSLKLRGVRSYSPREDETQLIEFSPLTIILGPNGSGKTTIIETLKFLMTGEEPPFSDSRRNFICYPYVQKIKQKSYASIELCFKTNDGLTCRARREISLPSTLRASTPSIQSCYNFNETGWKFINKQDDWGKAIISFFDLPNIAVINNVILCHQENSLWMFADASSVKLVIDKIFGCERYKKETKYIDTEIKSAKKMLEHLFNVLKRDKETADQKRQFSSIKLERTNEISYAQSEVKRIENNILILSQDMKDIDEKLAVFKKKQDDLIRARSKLEDLSALKRSLSSKLGSQLIPPEEISDVDLNDRLKNHNAATEESKTRLSIIKRDESKCADDLFRLNQQAKKLTNDINSIKVIELKYNESRATLRDKLTYLMESQKMNLVCDLENLETILSSLEDHEKILGANRTNLTEKEGDLSRRTHDISVQQNTMSNKQKLITRDIHTSTKRTVDLKSQMERVDPTSKDLLAVLDNLEKMDSIVKELIDESVSKSLQVLIDDSKIKITSVVQKTGAEVIRIKQELDHHLETIEQSKLELNKAKADEVDIKVSLDNIIKEHSDIKKSEKFAQNKYMDFSHSYRDFKRIVDQYKHEENTLKTHKVGDKISELEKIQSEIDEIDAKHKSLQQKQSELSYALSKSYETLKYLEMNNELRCKSAEIDFLMGTINQLETDLEGNKELIAKKDHLQTCHRQECEQKASFLTRVETLKRELKILSTNLDKYSNAYRNLSLTMAKIECTRLCLHDLEKLKDCFEKSVTTFHQQMIDKINELLAVRWRQTYQGADIKSIQLVADKIQRGDKENFNYYIAMVKGSYKYKMREQSSAGQKALASVIIRMTLAELFVKDLAFIALDEPTSNLDSANVVALAKVISTYVRRRCERDAGIQWIMITHDEDFVSALSDETYSNHYKVSKNSQGYSTITKSSYGLISSESGYDDA